MSHSARQQAAREHQPSRRGLLSTLVLLGIGMLAMVLITGCGSRPVTAREQFVPTAAPPATATVAPTAAPTATAEPTIAPERLELARDLLTSQGCIGCHTIDGFPEAIGQLGPNLTHVSTEAISIIASQEYKDSGGTATTAREYLRESIVEPTLFVAPDCPLGECPNYVMPKNFKTRLTEDEIEMLLDLLSTLK